jgi:hypothetical protein
MTIHQSVGIPPSQTLWLQNKEALSGAVESLLSRIIYLLHLTLRHCSEFEFICSQHGLGLSEKFSLQSQIALQSLNILQVSSTDFAKNEDGEGQTIHIIKLFRANTKINKKGIQKIVPHVRNLCGMRAKRRRVETRTRGRRRMTYISHLSDCGRFRLEETEQELVELSGHVHQSFRESLNVEICLQGTTPCLKDDESVRF